MVSPWFRGTQLAKSATDITRCLGLAHRLGEQVDDVLVEPELREVLERQIDRTRHGGPPRSAENTELIELSRSPGHAAIHVDGLVHERLNGGYRSVTSVTAYPITRLFHRVTPATKSKIGRGYRPVNRIANHAPITANTAAMSSTTSTMT